MSSFQRPTYISDVFNASLYGVDESSILSMYESDRRYLKLTGGIVTGQISLMSNFVMTSLSSTISISSTIANSITTAGGIIAASGSINSLGADTISASTSINIARAAGGDMITLSSTTTGARNTIKFVTDTQSWECGTRGSAAANPNTFYIYNSSYKLIMQSSGDTTLNGRLTISSTTSHLNFLNGANTGLIELANTSPTTLRFVNGYAMNVSSGGVVIESASTRTARYPLDFGATTQSVMVNLYQNGAFPLYGMGAANFALQLHTGQDFKVYTGTTSNAAIGTNIFYALQNGNCRAGTNIMGKGCFIDGFDNTGISGTGVKTHWNGTYGEVFAYDYTNSLHKDLKVGNTLYMNGSTGFCGIGASGSISFPLVVLSNISSSITGGYGYLNSSTAGSGTNTGSVAVSAYFGDRVFCKELNAFSDIRLKENIEPLDGDQAIEFVRKTDCISYNWIGGSKGARSLGYKAQQVLKNGLFQDIITFHPDSEMDEYVDEDEYVSPAGYKLTADYNHATVILHKALQVLLQRIEALEKRVHIKLI